MLPVPSWLGPWCLWGSQKGAVSAPALLILPPSGWNDGVGWEWAEHGAGKCSCLPGNSSEENLSLFYLAGRASEQLGGGGELILSQLQDKSGRAKQPHFAGFEGILCLCAMGSQ